MLTIPIQDAAPSASRYVPIGREGSIVLTNDKDDPTPLTLSSLPNRGGDQDFDSKHLGSIAAPPLRKGILPTHLAEAAAIRQAGEIREHVEDRRPFDGVMYWTDESVYVFEVDWPEETDSSLVHTRQTSLGVDDVPDPTSLQNLCHGLGDFHPYAFLGFGR